LMMSRTGWRETARMSANRAFVVKPWPLSRIARRMLTPSGCGLKGCQCRLVLPRSLADRGANYELVDLVFGEAGLPNGCDIFVSDLAGVLGHLVDHRNERLWESGIGEGGAALGGRRLAGSI